MQQKPYHFDNDNRQHSSLKLNEELVQDHSSLSSFVIFLSLLFMEPSAAANKSFLLVRRCHQSRFLVNGYLRRVPLQSRLLAYYMGDNEKKQGTVHRSTVRLRKTSDKRPYIEGCRISNRLIWGPLPPNDLGRIAQNVSEGEKLRQKGCTYMAPWVADKNIF